MGSETFISQIFMQFICRIILIFSKESGIGFGWFFLVGLAGQSPLEFHRSTFYGYLLKRGLHVAVRIRRTKFLLYVSQGIDRFSTVEPSDSYRIG